MRATPKRTRPPPTIPRIPIPWPGPVKAKLREEADTGAAGSEPLEALSMTPGVVVVARVEPVFALGSVVVLFASTRAVVVGTVAVTRCT
jgi:hypothetical protein